jgi:SAM-dependent methyltransferase
MDVSPKYESGMLMPAQQWVDLNRRLVFEQPSLRRYVAPFPPASLMQDVSAVSNEQHFAMHGTDIFDAVRNASPVPLHEFESILDFGCGCARLSRMFLGHPNQITGCDIDGRHVAWINESLSHMRAVKTEPDAALPFGDQSFDAIISISVFTHITEESQRLYLRELARISRSGAHLFLSTHGERAFSKVKDDGPMFNVIGIPREELTHVAGAMDAGKYSFVKQNAGHPTESDYEYGITFIPSSYVRAVWGEYFDVMGVVSGAIHDWQDIVVCRKR